MTGTPQAQCEKQPAVEERKAQSLGEALVAFIAFPFLGASFVNKKQRNVLALDVFAKVTAMLGLKIKFPKPRGYRHWIKLWAGIFVAFVNVFTISRAFLGKSGENPLLQSSEWWSPTVVVKPSTSDPVSSSSSWKTTLQHLLRDPSQIEFLGDDTAIAYQQEFQNISQHAFDVTNQSFCLEWSVTSDQWWTHHPEWQVDVETDSHYCFRYITDPKKVEFLQQIYKNQFEGNCSNSVSLHMFSSGWNADIGHLVKEVYAAVVHDKRPLQFMARAWHYAAPDDAGKGNLNQVVSKPACPTKTMNCFFLEISNCPQLRSEEVVGFQHSIVREHVLKPQLWFRKRMYDFLRKEQPKIIAPCTAVHVRRADVVLHNQHSRKYHPISEYLNVTASMDSTFHIHPNIFLLTDDHNAIGEAKTLFPKYNWMYIDRPRFKGAEGGWERHIPSSDPIFEMVVLQSIFRLIQQCDSLVRTKSGFGNLLQVAIQSRKEGARTVDLDASHIAKRAENANTVTVSREYNETTTPATRR